MAELSILLLGGFQVIRDNQEIDGFSTDKIRALLAYLSVEHDRAHRRQSLAGLLWPEYPERAARTSLRTALASLRRVIGDREADPPFILASRQTIAINSQGNIWVDANVLGGQLKTGQAVPSNVDMLAETAALYRGRFLQGFSLADSAPFDAWTLLKREQLERQVLATLKVLTQNLKQAGNLEKALIYARRRVELDPWQEPAQRELIWLLAANGQRAAALAQYEACREVLSEELGVEPERATLKLYQQIRDGTIRHATNPSGSSNHLSRSRTLEDPSAVFVGRERELSLLHDHLRTASAGRGTILFVIGGAGRGKSALLAEFAHQAIDATNFLVATGHCNAYSGRGDPYLPFRQILATLTGNFDNMWRKDELSSEQEARYESALPHTMRAILDLGPELIDTFVVGRRLYERAASVMSEDTAFLKHMHKLVNSQAASSSAIESTQHALIDQYTRVLERIASHTPLLIIIEDLHWADRGSLDLLLYLGRRVAKNPILILCAYRPDEVVETAGKEYRPIQDMANELIGLHGDIVVDLADVEVAASQKFVSDLLDLEPNRLDAGFRQALHDRTGGHPLFTTEMLRMLKEEGGLAVDANGHWLVSETLAWDHVPAKIEAVIQKRVGHLNSEALELLTVASVEGEQFSAEVVAQVLGRDKREVLQVLANELGDKHRLVQERDELESADRHISRFRFSHQLIQHYLYDRLGRGERRLLHKGVAEALETSFSHDLESITIPLAFHYAQTEVVDKALHYLTAAAHQARRRYDGRQAVNYYTRALSLAAIDSRESFELLAARASVHDIMAQREAQKADVDAMLAVAQALDDPALRCDALLALSSFHLATDIFKARKPARDALILAQSSGDGVREARALRLLSWEGRLGAHFDRANAYLKQAAARFTEAQMPGEAAECLFMLARRLPGSAKHVLDLEAAEQAMELSLESGDRRLEAIGLKNLAIAYTNQDNDAQALPLVEKALEIQSELGDRRELCLTLDVLGVVLARLDRRQEAMSMFQRCLTLSEEIGSDWGILGAVFGFWNYWFATDGEYESYVQFLDERLDNARRAGRVWLAGFLNWLKTLMLSELGQLEEAYNLTQTYEYQTTEGDPVSRVFVLMLTGVIKAELDQQAEARQDLEEALAVAKETRDAYLVSWPLTALANLALLEENRGAIAHALDLAEQAVAATKGVGDERQLAEALDTSARLKLSMGLSDLALEDSSALMRLLNSCYWLPRPQNYLHTHGLALRDQGREEESNHYIARAYERIMLVSDKLTDERIQKSWLHRVRVNREIVRSWQAIR